MHTNTAPTEETEEVFNFSDRISLANILSNNVLTNWLHHYYEDFCKHLCQSSHSPILLIRRNITAFVLAELWRI